MVTIKRASGADIYGLEPATDRQFTLSTQSVTDDNECALRGTIGAEQGAEARYRTNSSSHLGSSIKKTRFEPEPNVPQLASDTNSSAIAALIVRLNKTFRNAARHSLWAAVNTDVTALRAGAKALRNSGLCQLFGVMVTSVGAMAGAGLSLNGARQSQSRFNDAFKTRTSGLPAPDSALDIPHDSARQMQPIEPAEIGTSHRLGGTTTEFMDAHTQPIEAPETETSHLCGGTRARADASDEQMHSIEAPEGGTPRRRSETTPRPDVIDAEMFARATRAQTEAQTQLMKWSGLSGIASDGAKIPGAGLTMGATHYQEDKERHEADSVKAKARAEDERDSVNSHDAVSQDVLNRLGEMVHLDNDARTRIIDMR